MTTELEEEVRKVIAASHEEYGEQNEEDIPRLHREHGAELKNIEGSDHD